MALAQLRALAPNICSHDYGNLAMRHSSHFSGYVEPFRSIGALHHVSSQLKGTIKVLAFGIHDPARLCICYWRPCVKGDQIYCYPPHAVAQQ